MICCGWTWFFFTRIHVYHHGQVFSKLLLYWVLILVNLGSPPNLLQVLEILEIYCYLSVVLSVIFFLFLYLAPELFCFLCIRVFICLSAFSINFLEEFSFVILEGSVLLELLGSVSESFLFSFFYLYLLVYFFQLYCQFCLWLTFFILYIFFSLVVYFLVYFSFCRVLVREHK